MDTATATQPGKRHLTVWHIYTWLTIVLGVLPFIPYLLAVATQRLPEGGNHGPWWGTPYEVLYYLCTLFLFVLAALSPLTGLVQTIIRRMWWPPLAGIGLAAIQLALVYAHLVLLFWLID
ncbi:MAG: hypothetical protein ACYC7E_18870 [Armatimonadota bacterium]